MRLRKTALLIWGATLCLSLSLGCNGAKGKTPGGDTLRRYLDAIEADDPDTAYSFMDKDYRKRVPKKTYKKRWKTYRQEMLALARRTREAAKKKKKISVDAKAEFKSGQKVTLVWERKEKAWRLKGGAGTSFAGTGPKSTLLSLVRAVKKRDFGSFLKLLSRGRRKALLQAIFKRLERLKANIDRSVERRGTRIRFQYDSRYYIDLIREDGVWKIYDFN